LVAEQEPELSSARACLDVLQAIADSLSMSSQPIRQAIPQLAQKPKECEIPFDFQLS
jgi:hypothetical protein